MTINGLCIFLDIAHVTWKDYAGNPVYSAICTKVEEIIRDQKFCGAAADLLNTAIIARDLGLAEKVNHGGQPDNPVITATLTPEAAEAIKDALDKAY